MIIEEGPEVVPRISNIIKNAPDMLNQEGKIAALVIQENSFMQTIQNVDKLLKAGNVLDKGGLTAVGRALQKHGSRPNSVFPKATGNVASINAQGEAVLKEILSNSNVTPVIRHHARFGDILEYKICGKMGARFSSDGKIFIGFIEP